jgi:hypothetical protein
MSIPQAKRVPVADSLVRQGTPFIFVRGHDAEVIPERHQGALRIAKPAAVEQIIRSTLEMLTSW